MLTEASVRSAKPAPKAYKRYDERGMFLFVTPSGARLWRLKYRIFGKEKLLALGEYPDVSLKRAREKRDEARSLVADGIDPAAKKRAERQASADTFAAIAAEYIELRREHLNQRTLAKAEWILNDWLLKYRGSQPLNTIKPVDILSVCRRLESRGKRETAHRTRALAGRILRYAVATGRLERDPTADLRGALAPVSVKHHAAITDPQQIGELLRSIDGYQGQPSTAAALKLAPLVFVRPGELRAAEWSEFDLDKAEWRIPGSRMKMGEQHIVPGDRCPSRSPRDYWRLQIPVPFSSQRRSMHQRQHDQRCPSSPRLQQGADGRARIPVNGFDVPQRTGVASRSD